MFPGVQPLARRFGNAVVGGKPVSLNFVVFSPGVTLPAQLGTLPAEYGYPAISVLQDNGDPLREPAPNAISDNCAPLASTTVNYGVSLDNPDTAGVNEGGITVQSNPAAAGTYSYHNRTISIWDADDDGWDNSIDTCPYNVNVGDPTVAASGDPDGDGLDDACDPTPTESTTDYDGDGYVNRLDFCPQVADGLATTNQADRDRDNIGDACDTSPDVGEGPAPVDATSTSDVTITGAPVTATAAPTTTAAATGTAAATKTATAAATGRRPPRRPQPGHQDGHSRSHKTARPAAGRDTAVAARTPGLATATRG
jgi:hypothetical protein